MPNLGGRRRVFGVVSTGSLTEASSICSKSSVGVGFQEPKSALDVFSTFPVVAGCGGLQLCCDDGVLTFSTSREVFDMLSATISRFAMTGVWLRTSQQLQFSISCSSMQTSVTFPEAIVVPLGRVNSFGRSNLCPRDKWKNAQLRNTIHLHRAKELRRNC